MSMLDAPGAPAPIPDPFAAPPIPAPSGEIATGRNIDGRLVYAVGDIHGRYDLFKQLLAQIWTDVAHRAAGRTPVLILCGDFIDRGPQSPEVIDALNWLHRRPDLILQLLKGNHEQAMLDFVHRPERAAAWLEFGGAETLAAYGIAPPGRRASAEELVRLRDALLDQVPASHMQLLQRLQNMVIIGDYAFVHAGVRPGVPLAHQVPADLLWIRQGFVDFDGPHDRFIVHGHSWASERPHLTPHRLGLDTGAYETGVLTAVRLEDGKMELLQARAGMD